MDLGMCQVIYTATNTHFSHTKITSLSFSLGISLTFQERSVVEQC
jgi:hypothetical protein